MDRTNKRIKRGEPERTATTQATGTNPGRATDMNADTARHGKAARAATTHPAAGAGDACRRSSESATGRAGDVPAADIQRKAQTMKKTISAQWGLGDPDPRSADAAKVVEDAAWRDDGRDVVAVFVSASGDEVTFSATDRSAAWVKLKQAAEAAAKRDGVNTRSRKAVGAYAEAAMRDYAEAVQNGPGRELLPNTDWRTRAARRHGDKIVAAMLYKEAADAINAETARAAEEEAAWREHHEQQVAQEEAAIIATYERRKVEVANRPGKGTSRHAGKTIGGNLKGKGRYHILPDGQTIEVAGDSTQYRITGKTAWETLDKLLDALKNGDGWTAWSKKYRARFSTPCAKAFAKKYIENERSKAGIGWNYGHQPKARLKP